MNLGDNWGEYIALGLDAIIFGVCFKSYWNYSFSSSILERAHRLGCNPSYESLTPTEREYVVYQGEVKAVGKPIISMNNPDAAGVIQRITITEHAITRNSSGFWTDHKNKIQEAYNVVPFVLRKGNMIIEILDPLGTETMDLDTVHDTFESSKVGFWDQFVGFFYGVRQRGIETSEDMLKEGSVITAIGEVSLDNQGILQLSPSSRGYPYFLSSMPVTSLLRKIEEQKTTYKWLSYLFGTVGLVISYVIAKQWWERRKAKMRDEEIKRKLVEMRKDRRKKARPGGELDSNELCVVCRDNPKEIIILPCGHVCICEDCSAAITKDCPICRSPIETKAAAFIS